MSFHTAKAELGSVLSVLFSQVLCYLQRQTSLWNFLQALPTLTLTNFCGKPLHLETCLYTFIFRTEDAKVHILRAETNLPTNTGSQNILKMFLKLCIQIGSPLGRLLK